MKQWLKQNKYTLTVFGAIFVVLSCTYLYIIHPRKVKVDELREQLKNKTSQIRTKGWPTDHARLQTIRKKRQEKLEDIKEQTLSVIQKATSTLMNRIQEEEESKQTFMYYTQRLDYKEEYADVMRALEAKGLQFSPRVLGISESSENREVYKLMLQLWTLDEIMSVALKNELKPVRKTVKLQEKSEVERLADSEREGGGRKQRVVDARLHQPVRYAVASANKNSSGEHYLLEFPLSMSVRCAPDQLNSFLQSLHDADKFIFLDNIQIQKLPLGKDKGKLKVDMKCSTFFTPEENLQESLKAVEEEEEEEEEEPARPPIGV